MALVCVWSCQVQSGESVGGLQTVTSIRDVTHGDYKPHVEDYCSLILVIYINDHFIILLRVPNESEPDG